MFRSERLWHLRWKRPWRSKLGHSCQSKNGQHGPFHDKFQQKLHRPRSWSARHPCGDNNVAVTSMKFDHAIVSAPSSVIIVECSSCGNDARTWKGGGAENSKTVWTWNLLNWKWLWLWWLEQWVQVFSLHVLRTKPCWVKQGNQSWHKAAWNKSGNKRIALHDGFHPLPTVCVAERAWRRSCCKTLAASFGCRYIPCRGKKKGWKESYSRTWSTHKCRSLN